MEQKENKMVYVVTLEIAFDAIENDHHSYIVGVFDDRNMADEYGKKEFGRSPRTKYDKYKIKELELNSTEPYKWQRDD